jgi:putative Mg2+ transporter-C (MgtC) family protein
MWTKEAGSLVSLLLAVLLGGAVGLEREFRGRPAGLRTHILVCLGATLIMITSQRMAVVSQDLPAPFRIVVDPGRIAAGIVTGIGFLGAGAILRIGDLVRGLTTAGTIWLVAALGISLGQGLYLLATACTVLVLAVLTVLSRVESRIHPIIYRSLMLRVPLDRAVAIEQDARAALSARDIRVQDIHHTLGLREGSAELTFRVSLRHRLQGGEIVQAVAALEGVTEARWF